MISKNAGSPWSTLTTRLMGRTDVGWCPKIKKGFHVVVLNKTYFESYQSVKLLIHSGPCRFSVKPAVSYPVHGNAGQWLQTLFGMCGCQIWPFQWRSAAWGSWSQAGRWAVQDPYHASNCGVLRGVGVRGERARGSTSSNGAGQLCGYSLQLSLFWEWIWSFSVLTPKLKHFSLHIFLYHKEPIV